MDLTHGLFGLIGFLLFEFSWLFSKRRSPKFQGKPVGNMWEYYLTVGIFGVITLVAVSIFGPSDLSSPVWPLTFSNPTLAEAGRSIGLGIACLLICKSPSRLTDPNSGGGGEGPRTQTTVVGPAADQSLFSFIRNWRSGF